MLTNCLAACAHLTITVSEIERDIVRKSSLFHTPLHSTPPLGGFPSEYRHPVWYRKTRMAWLPMVKKFRKCLYSFWRNSRTWQTDGRTDRHRMPAIAALMHSIARQKCWFLLSLSEPVVREKFYIPHKKKLISSALCKTCQLDPAPTWLVKDMRNYCHHSLLCCSTSHCQLAVFRPRLN